MFGLSDNSNKTTQGAPLVNDVSSGMSIDTAPPAPVDAPPADNQISSLPPGVSSGSAAAANTASAPVPDDVPVADPPASAAPANDAVPSVNVLPDGSISDVNLEKAYIPTDPPQTPAPANDSKPSNQPSAASLLDDSHDEELLKLKQQALHSLAPLVDHLDQTAEEKFKTTMMLIQASDNADLIPEAYEAAGKIEDEKVRAQALLDVVNEINYFTQQAHADNKES